jgi:dynein heavy chain
MRFTYESPEGLKAGLKRTFSQINQEKIEYIDSKEWKPLLYTITFFHSVVQVTIILFC